jgi:hypothetical protein
MRTALAAALLAAAVGTTPAGAAEPSIRPGIGIAKIRLGMTEAQLRAAMGPPDASHREPSTFGRVRAVIQYAAGTYTVVFDGPPRALRVTAVSTRLTRHRSAEGFGVGTPERVLKARLGSRVRCGPLKTVSSSEGPFVARDQRWRRCAVAGPRDTQTVWFTNLPQELINELPFVRVTEWNAKARVVEAAVRTTGSSATHFGL